MTPKRPLSPRKPLIVRQQVERAVASALMKGVPVVREDNANYFRVGYESTCENPYPVETYGARSELLADRSRKPIRMLFYARCRKCAPCRKARSQMWQIRAMHEYEMWPRTIFGTVTMSLDHHYMLDARIEAGVWDDTLDKWKRPPRRLRELSTSEQFTARVTAFGEEMQRFLKRLRKNRGLAPGAARYLMVAEAHDSARTDAALRGRPHVHLLLHECVAGCLVTGSPVEALAAGTSGEWVRSTYQSGGHRRTGVFVHDDSVLRKAWQFGFTKFQFAENAKAAAYLCKYLTKASDERVRASLGYGQLDHISEPASKMQTTSVDTHVENHGPPTD